MTFETQHDCTANLHTPEFRAGWARCRRPDRGHDHGKVVWIPDGCSPPPAFAVAILDHVGRVAEVQVGDFEVLREMKCAGQLGATPNGTYFVFVVPPSGGSLRSGPGEFRLKAVLQTSNIDKVNLGRRSSAFADSLAPG
ncbi:MAG TPA: hypothetical protein PLR25_24340 [Planctomycetaceae bacterium]|nr:hypothetical protein [Planctomycetaceae bacterium]